MTATAAQILQVRRMTNEPTAVTYSDAQIQAFIEAYPLMDEVGTEPYYFNYLTVPPSMVANTNWIPTYDLNLAAADIWLEKAAVVAQDPDFQSDGGSFSRSQVYQQFMNMHRHYFSRHTPGTIRLRPAPRPYPGQVDEDL